jgi:hypothetical protein
MTRIGVIVASQPKNPALGAILLINNSAVTVR